MSNLQTLEDIAVQLRDWFSEDTVSQPIHIEVEGNSAEQLKLEIDRLSNNAKQKAAYFKGRVEELEAILDVPIDLSSPNMVANAAGIISDIQRTGRVIELARKTAEELNNAYRQKQLAEADFRDYNELSAQIDQLQTQMSSLKRKFLGLGGLIFNGQIRDLNSRISSLSEIYLNQYEEVRLPKIGYPEKRRFEDAQGKVFEEFANELFAQYRTLLEQLSDRETSYPRLNPHILESLFDDYISKYFKSKIEQELQANKRRDDYDERDIVAVLEDTELVNEALAVLRDGLTPSHDLLAGQSYTKEQEEGIRALDSRLESLPSNLRSIVQRELNRGNKKTINQEFAEIAEYLTQAPLEVEKRRIFASFLKAQQHILSALSNTYLPYEVTDKR